jgi:PAS domain S-box-containing protein
MNRLLRWHPLFWGLLVTACGFLLAWRITVWQEIEQYRTAKQRFYDLAHRASEQLVQRMTIYQYGLRGMRGALIVMGEQGITRSQVIKYYQSRDYKKEFFGSRGYGFIRRVPVLEEDEFLRRARADDQPGFTVHQLTPHENERLIIQYIQPEEGNRQAIGLDIASEANRRAAAWQAIRSGEPTLTHPITLVQAAGQTHQGFLLMLPTYQTGFTPASLQAREESAFGLAYTPLVINEILSDFDFRHGEFAMSLYDLSEQKQKNLFYDSLATEKAADGLIETFSLDIFGRQWQVEIKALRPFIASLNLKPPKQIGLEIAISSLALAGLIYGFLLSQAQKREAFQQKSRLAAIVDGANDAIVGMTLEGEVTDWNLAAEVIFGIPESNAIGFKVVDLIVPDDLCEIESELLARVREGELVHHQITRRKRFDGSILDVSLTLSPIRDDKGRISGIAGMMRDISTEMTHQKRIQELNNQLEREVFERTRHLEVAVQELIDFSYLASHDLRSPLRAIDGFSALLPAECENLSPTGRNYVQRIRLAAQQMGQVIDDMVALVGIVRSDLEPRRLNLSEIAEKELRMRVQKEPQRQVVIHIEPELWVMADPKLTPILLHQLIDNAWKFTHQTEEARIEVGLEVYSGKTMFFVRDNGIGFDMTYADRIFTPFQRLPHDQDYPGSGIGLAIAQRIVRKHGGFIAVEAFIDQGSTFYFSLPLPHHEEEPYL